MTTTPTASPREIERVILDSKHVLTLVDSPTARVLLTLAAQLAEARAAMTKALQGQSAETDRANAAEAALARAREVMAKFTNCNLVIVDTTKGSYWMCDECKGVAQMEAVANSVKHAPECRQTRLSAALAASGEEKRG
jgi:hypothetical protein